MGISCSPRSGERMEVSAGYERVFNSQLSAPAQAWQFFIQACVLLQGIMRQGHCLAYLPLWFELLKADQPHVTPGSHGAMLLAGAQHIPPCFPPVCPQQLLQYIVGYKTTQSLLTSSHSYSPRPLLKGAIIFFLITFTCRLPPPFFFFRFFFVLFCFLLLYFLC